MVRRVPHLPLPQVAFVPGKTARPHEGWERVAADSERFLWACDLLDADCGFEAHELLEALWHEARARQDSDDEHILRGLVRLAAARVKAHQGNAGGQMSHLDGALTEFRAVHASAVRGLRPVDLIHVVNAARAGSFLPLP